MNNFFLTAKPWWGARLMQTGFVEFTHRSGCFGLAKVSGTRLEVCAISATYPRTGQLRAFITDAKGSFAEVRVMEIWNAELARALVRYGFAPFSEVDGMALATGMRWFRPATWSPPGRD